MVIEAAEEIDPKAQTKIDDLEVRIVLVKKKIVIEVAVPTRKIQRTKVIKWMMVKTKAEDQEVKVEAKVAAEVEAEPVVEAEVKVGVEIETTPEAKAEIEARAENGAKVVIGVEVEVEAEVGVKLEVKRMDDNLEARVKARLMRLK